MTMRKYVLEVNGIQTETGYAEEDIKNTYLPLLGEWTRLQKEKGGRIIVFLAAPPGCGKTTLACFLEYLSKHTPGITPLQAIGIDGFHYPQEYLDRHYANTRDGQVRLSEIKGNAVTFDVDKLREYIIQTRDHDMAWPNYSRLLHDPVEDAIMVTEKIVLLEGNYLLCDEEPWNSLEELCDDSVFVEIATDVLKERLVNRKLLTGCTQAEALEFVNRSDLKNVEVVLKHAKRAHHTIHLDEDGTVVEQR